jgi:hypothetical protein
LAVSAFVEVDMPTTTLKMIMDDLMIMNDLEANSGVTSRFSFGVNSCNFQPKHIHSAAGCLKSTNRCAGAAQRVVVFPSCPSAIMGSLAPGVG